ncbi:hypothetical protein N0V93_005137 [Gnomoniopsis smithogilvyi]|uniref:Uncharacterized protein n=1 Tax=Gnomoniopsis smithogilvyi TaxID=1191159 RepID=A0A9W9CXT0_9PEZI|nr:hypothetical protein N0V93_005137 [Gnomoniopsis smithogilvyi]
MGAFQLPDSVDGAAVACLLYSALCLIANLILVWLVWVHRERTSYVAFISYFTLLATVSSLVQQLYDYILWVDIMTWQFWYGKDHMDDAEVQYQNEIFGLKLALSYIRIFCFMVEASLVFFFSFALAATVYGWWAKKPGHLRKLSVIGRIVPITLGIISIILLQLEFTHRSFFVYFVIANAQFILSLCGSCLFLLMILFKYLQTRRRLHTWLTLEYGKAASATTASSGTRSTAAKFRRSRAYSGSQPRATFDNWLVIRLSIAFATLCVFEWTNISPRVKNRQNVLESANETGPDLSHSRAMSTVTGYLSGVSPSLLAFLVFGTTKAFQRKMYRSFVPRFLRKDDDTLTSLRSQLPISSTNNSSNARASNYYTPQTPKHYRSTSSIRSPPESVAFTPGTPRTSRSVPTRDQLSHYRSDSSIRKPEPIIVEELPPVDLKPLPLKPIYEPAATWLEDESPPESRQRASQIGVAISEPTSPANPVVSPWREPTFLRDADDDDSIQSEERRRSRGRLPQFSIPLSRFNNNNNNASGTAEDKWHMSEAGTYENNGGEVGHRRHMSETGSFTQIWSEGRRPSTRNEAGSSARLTLGQGARPGRDYSKYVAPVRRGSAM